MLNTVAEMFYRLKVLGDLNIYTNSKVWLQKHTVLDELFRISRNKIFFPKN